METAGGGTQRTTQAGVLLSGIEGNQIHQLQSGSADTEHNIPGIEGNQINRFSSDSAVSRHNTG